MKKNSDRVRKSFTKAAKDNKLDEKTNLKSRTNTEYNTTLRSKKKCVIVNVPEKEC